MWLTLGRSSILEPYLAALDSFMDLCHQPLGMSSFFMHCALALTLDSPILVLATHPKVVLILLLHIQATNATSIADWWEVVAKVVQRSKEVFSTV
jgi:hypothetical protein